MKPSLDRHDFGTGPIFGVMNHIESAGVELLLRCTTCFTAGCGAATAVSYMLAKQQRRGTKALRDPVQV